MINTLPQSLIDVVTLILETPQSLNWAVGDNKKFAMLPNRQDGKTIVWMNANEVISKTHPDFRITPESINNHIGNRMDRAKTHFISGKWMDPPDISVSHHPDFPIDIENGRHRIAASLSLGHEWFPASVAPHEIEQLKKHITVKETQ